MATFKAIALEHHIKSDGTVRIKNPYNSLPAKEIY